MTPDIFFVSGNSPEAERNWARLRRIAPRARRIDFQPSILAAYVACASASRAPFCFMVDGDNWVLDGFAFEVDFEPAGNEVAIWRASNPVNGLVYGNGAIKLLPASLALGAANSSAIDVGTSLGVGYRVVDVVASEHRFNTSAFDAWRTAFRECVKLSSNLIRGADRETGLARLSVWCAGVVTTPRPAYAEDCVAGARSGRDFGARHAGDTTTLSRINDTIWLREFWEARGGRAT